MILHLCFIVLHLGIMLLSYMAVTQRFVIIYSIMELNVAIILIGVKIDQRSPYIVQNNHLKRQKKFT